MEIPRGFLSLSEERSGDFCVLKGILTNHFPFVGTYFKTGWDSKGTAVPLALGHPIGAGGALLAEVSKGDGVPLAVVSKGGGAALASGIQRRAEPSWREESKETGVSWHTTLRAKSSVLYLWRPWVAERGGRGGNKHFRPATEQADFASHRERNRGFAFSKIRLFGCRLCCAMERQSAAEPRNGAASPGGAKGISNPPQRRVLLQLMWKW